MGEREWFKGDIYLSFHLPIRIFIIALQCQQTKTMAKILELLLKAMMIVNIDIAIDTTKYIDIAIDTT